MNYFSLNIGDYAQATMHLSLTEDAIFGRLLRRYYSEEGPIVDDLPLVCRWVGARTEDERQAVDIVLREFFQLRDGYWHNKRADEEIDAYRKKAETNRVNGQSGGRPSKKPKETQSVNSGFPDQTQSDATDNPTVTLTKNQEPRTSNQEPVKKNTVPAVRVPSLSAADLEAKGVAAQTAIEFLALRKRKKAPLTEIAMAGIARETALAGWTIDSALQKCIERGWTTFEASWVTARGSGPGEVMNRQEAQEARNREVAERFSRGA